MGIRSPFYWVFALFVVAFAGAAHAGEGVVALQTADPSCPDDSGDRYVPCGNGTVTDNETGLVWLANANCFGIPTWHEAMELVAGLGDLQCDPEPGDCDCGLADNSSPGDWRLASRDEWMAMTEDAAGRSCSPTITNDLGNDCWDQQCVEAEACSFYGVQASWYWSSSSTVSDPTDAWSVNLSSGSVVEFTKGGINYFWPVRGGQ